MTNNNMQRMLQNLDIPIAKRRPSDYENVIGFHVTRKNNLKSILELGLTARRSKQSYDRPNAVYLFLEMDEINATNIDILGLANEDLCIVKVNIPAKYVLQYMSWDGLYNVTFGTSRSAVQYLENIPPEWIEEVN
jgi:hypothetical protein